MSESRQKFPAAFHAHLSRAEPSRAEPDRSKLTRYLADVLPGAAKSVRGSADGRAVWVGGQVCAFVCGGGAARRVGRPSRCARLAPLTEQHGTQSVSAPRRGASRSTVELVSKIKNQATKSYFYKSAITEKEP